MRWVQMRRTSSSMACSGRIFAGLTIAESSPRSSAWCRNIEFSAWRAAGDRPNETLETPRIVEQPGISFFTRSMRSEEHTSELQSRQYLVCRLLLEKNQQRDLDQNFLFVASSSIICASF